MYEDGTSVRCPPRDEAIRDPNSHDMDTRSDMDTYGDLSYTGCVWREVKGSKGQYEVSDIGEVRNAKTGRILKKHLCRGEYHISLSGYINRTVTVSSLVCRAFIGEGRARHKNGDKLDNRVENLEVT